MSQACELMRILERNKAVIRLNSTGAIMCIELSQPIDMTNSCPFSPLNPMPAMVELGDYRDKLHRGCTLTVQWCKITHPPPKIFRRTSRR